MYGIAKFRSNIIDAGDEFTILGHGSIGIYYVMFLYSIFANVQSRSLGIDPTAAGTEFYIAADEQYRYTVLPGIEYAGGTVGASTSCGGIDYCQLTSILTFSNGCMSCTLFMMVTDIGHALFDKPVIESSSTAAHESMYAFYAYGH
jgi:hypothetical protein